MNKNYFFFNKKAFINAFLLFFIGIIIGIAFSFLLLKYNNAPTNMTIRIKQENNAPEFLHILSNNIIVALIMISGSYLVKIPTILSLVINGCVLGFVLETNVYTTSHLLYFLKILSVHGFVELTALLLAANLGFTKNIFSNVKNTKRALATITLIVFLLSIAAILETTVSPLLW